MTETAKKLDGNAISPYDVTPEVEEEDDFGFFDHP